MEASQKAIEIIKKYEGCRLAAYRDSKGIWTIGYGHTGNVQPEQTITQAQAEDYLKKDLSKFEKHVAKYSKYGWNQNEFDALISFAYNIGNIDQLTNKGKRSRAEIAEKIPAYDKIDKKPHKLLHERREMEKALFLQPVSKNTGNVIGQSESGIVEYSLKTDGERLISKNFKVREFKCKDGSDKILVDVDFARNKLQAIRNHFGAAITINSAYRTESYNKKIKGASKSYHLTGQAFDIVVSGHTPLEVARYAQTLDIKGIIQYNTFVHIDSRRSRYWARDNNGHVTKKETF